MSSSSSPSSSQVGPSSEGNGSGRRRRRRRGGGGRRPYEPEAAAASSSSSAAAAVGAAAASSSSMSRRRSNSNNGVWPEPFVEALALQVATDTSRSFGRLAAASAVAILFQVCSTWRAVSRSELLWQHLTRRIWNRTHRLHDSWRDEYIYHHRTARNFRVRRYVHNTLHFDDGAPANDGGVNLICLRITLSDHHLAAGFSDGSVRLFNLQALLHLHTFRPFPRDLLGRFSRAVSGIILTLPRLIFASLDGDIHVSLFNNHDLGPGPGPTRRAHLGDLVNDGVLVDFTGCNQFWVGLYAGVPGRAIHIWDSGSEDLLFVGGTLTDPEAVMGWHMLTEWTTEFVGRVRVTDQELAVACTGLRVLVLDLGNQGIALGEEEARRGLIVGCLDACDNVCLMVNERGVARVRIVRTLEEVCRFNLRGVGSARGILGCINSGYALVCAGGVIRVWEIEHGEYLYSLRERIGEATVLSANNRYAAGSGDDRTIHLWDFGA